MLWFQWILPIKYCNKGVMSCLEGGAYPLSNGESSISNLSLAYRMIHMTIQKSLYGVRTITYLYWEYLDFPWNEWMVELRKTNNLREVEKNNKFFLFATMHTIFVKHTIPSVLIGCNQSLSSLVPKHFYCISDPHVNIKSSAHFASSCELPVNHGGE
jgi:hypothetical protein